MEFASSVTYPLDNSAIIHLAAFRKEYTNAFRIAITLKEPVCVQTLQTALTHITPRFPTVIAGIKRDLFQYEVVPVSTPPQVQKEQGHLVPMTKDEIRRCAFRVMYHKNTVAGEFFHSLTDGYGGMVVMNTLIAEYLRRRHSVFIPATDLILDTKVSAVHEELIDDYFTHAGQKAAVLNHRRVYQLPGKPSSDHRTHITTEVFDAETIRNTAHRYGVSVTTLLTAVMSASIIDIQKRHAESKHLKPVQIMVPVNLRRLFPSRTLRNFSLFALPCIAPQTLDNAFESLLHSIEKQLSEQTTREYMAGIMATHTNAERFPLYRGLPLLMKLLILRIGHQLFGEGNSCISLSNLGVISLPFEMRDYVEDINFALTPRIKSPYNCGIVTYDGVMSINFSRHSAEPELEEVFFAKLQQLICIEV